MTDEELQDNSIKQYIREFLKTPLLNIEEERKLFNDMNLGDPTAREKIIEANLRLVFFIAKRFIGQGVELIDLVQEGSIGLIKALKKFDITKGYKFSTYAIWWIKQAVTKAIICKGRTIRVPYNKNEILRHIIKIQNQLLYELNREPSMEELAAKCQLEVGEVEQFLCYMVEPLRLDEPASETSENTLADFIPDKSNENKLETKTNIEFINQLLQKANLNDKQKEVILLRFGFDSGLERTLEEVGKIMDLTRERVRQIEAKALGKMRQLLHYQDLQEETKTKR